MDFPFKITCYTFAAAFNRNTLYIYGCHKVHINNQQYDLKQQQIDCFYIQFWLCMKCARLIHCACNCLTINGTFISVKFYFKTCYKAVVEKTLH